MKKTTNNVPLCEFCTKGFDSFLSNNINPFCRYKSCHNGKTCSHFKKHIETEDKTNGKKI